MRTEEIGTKNLDGLLICCSKLLFVLPSRFESIVAMAHSLEKNRWGPPVQECGCSERDQGIGIHQRRRHALEKKCH